MIVMGTMLWGWRGGWLVGGREEGAGGRRKRLVNAIRSRENAPGLKGGILTFITIWQWTFSRCCVVKKYNLQRRSVQPFLLKSYTHVYLCAIASYVYLYITLRLFIQIYPCTRIRAHTAGSMRKILPCYIIYHGPKITSRLVCSVLYGVQLKLVIIIIVVIVVVVVVAIYSENMLSCVSSPPLPILLGSCRLVLSETDLILHGREVLAFHEQVSRLFYPQVAL